MDYSEIVTSLLVILSGFIKRDQMQSSKALKDSVHAHKMSASNSAELVQLVATMKEDISKLNATHQHTNSNITQSFHNLELEIRSLSLLVGQLPNRHDTLHDKLSIIHEKLVELKGQLR